MTGKVLQARTLTEAYLCLSATGCSHCQQGPLVIGGAQPSAAGGGAGGVAIAVTCGRCGATEVREFVVDDRGSADPTAPGLLINPTPDPSRLLDVGQWLSLHRTLADRADRQSDKGDARTLRLLAGLCLDEALKFFDDEENDLPAAVAFFTEPSRERFRRSPEQFSRQRILGLRSKLPKLTPTDLAIDPAQVPRWWEG